MNIIDYVKFSRHKTEGGLVYEHATVPTFTLAYYFEILLSPNHPDHSAMMGFASDIISRAREEKMAKGRESMRKSRAAMSNEEWSRIVD